MNASTCSAGRGVHKDLKEGSFVANEVFDHYCCAVRGCVLRRGNRISYLYPGMGRHHGQLRILDAVVSAVIQKGYIPNYRTTKGAKEDHRTLCGCSAIKANTLENSSATEKPDGGMPVVRPCSSDSIKVAIFY